MNTSTRAKTYWAIGNTIVIIVAIVPVLWIASLSFKDPSTITDATFFPRKWTLDNYRGIFETSLFNRALVNSIGIALIATFLAVVVGSMAAYAIARLRFPGKGALVGATFAPRWTGRSTTRQRCWSSPRSWTASRPTCPAVSGSGSPWAGRSCAARRRS
jgi:ABC-type glycerol-3-phosphate transport system permease component